MHRIRFEPIDIEDEEDYQDLYNKLRQIMNSLYKDDHSELLPSIRKIYPIDELGFPLNPNTNTA